MNKSTLITVLAVALLIALGGVFLMNGGAKTGTTTSTTPDAMNAAAQSADSPEEFFAAVEEGLENTLPACDHAALIGMQGNTAQAELEKDGHTVRLLPPDSMMTMDFREDRVNIEMDESGTVTRVWCG